MENKAPKRCFNGETVSSNTSVRHKEKRRTESINKAFFELRKCIPNVPCDTKLSKIKTLHLASSYISHLSDILENSKPGEDTSEKEFNINFKARQPGKARKNRTNFSAKIREIKSPARRASIKAMGFGSNMSNHSNGDKLKKGKGRTGWPETVWADALENGTKQSEKPGQYSPINGIQFGMRAPFMSCGPSPVHQLDVNVSNFRSIYGEVEFLLNRPEHYSNNFENQQTTNLVGEKFTNDFNNYNFSDTILSNHIDAFESTLYTQYNSEVSPPPSSTTSNTEPDLIHASAVSFPILPFNSNATSGPLPSISTLCYNDKTKLNHHPLQDLQCSDDNLLDLDGSEFENSPLQNGISDEPVLIELQPAIRFNGNFTELC